MFPVVTEITPPPKAAEVLALPTPMERFALRTKLPLATSPPQRSPCALLLKKIWLKGLLGAVPRAASLLIVKRPALATVLVLELRLNVLVAAKALVPVMLTLEVVLPLLLITALPVQLVL